MADGEEEVLRPEKDFSNRFMQQKLKHFFPQYTPMTVILTLILTAIIFIPIGAAIVVASGSVFEIDVRYDNYSSCTYNRNDGIRNHTINGVTFSQGCATRVPLTLPRMLAPPVYIYYRMKGFHQNYRLYSQSVLEAQMAGKADDWDIWDSKKNQFKDDNWGACAPVDSPRWKNVPTTAITVNGISTEYQKMVYKPCGVIAWSMFNDTINLYATSDGTVPASGSTGAMPSSARAVCLGGAFNSAGATTLAAGTPGSYCEKSGIAFERADKNSRYRPATSSDRYWTGNTASGVTTDPYLSNGWYAGEVGHPVPRLDDEDLMVWGRIAGLADFRKLYRKITTNLPAGQYFIDVQEFYDTTSVQAEKHVIIATTSWIGGKNYVLGGLFLTFGSISFALAIGFLAMYVLKSKG